MRLRDSVNYGQIIGYLLAILIILPIIWLLISSFRPLYDLEQSPFGLPMIFTISNYNQVFSISSFTTSFKNSLIIAIVTTIIVISIAIPVSYVLSRYSFWGKRTLNIFSLFGAYLFAPAILAFPYFKILASLGLVNNLIGIILAHICFCLPFSFSIGNLIFKSLPHQVEEVAMIDNVSTVKRITRLVIPSVKPQILVLILLIFAISWKEFFYAFVIASDTTSMTIPVLVFNQYNGESLNWNILCTMSTIMMIPSFVVLFIGWKFNVTNILTLGIKG